MIFEENFAGTIIRYQFRYAGTEEYMFPYIKASESDTYDIMASQEHIESQRPHYPENQEDSYVEYKSLIELTSRALLPHNCCLFHAAAFLWNGFAWLITGSSGSGKTTHFKNWKDTYRDKVRIICGDMPLLQLREDGSIWVHPSPWNGKERYKGKLSAPLGGVVLLEKDESDSIELLSAKDSAVPVFLQFAIRPETEEQIRQMAEIENHLLKNYPVWKLKNRGDLEAVKTAASAFMKNLEHKEI